MRLQNLNALKIINNKKLPTVVLIILSIILLGAIVYKLTRQEPPATTITQASPILTDQQVAEQKKELTKEDSIRGLFVAANKNAKQIIIAEKTYTTDEAGDQTGGFQVSKDTKTFLYDNEPKIHKGISAEVGSMDDLTHGKEIMITFETSNNKIIDIWIP